MNANTRELIKLSAAVVMLDEMAKASAGAVKPKSVGGGKKTPTVRPVVAPNAGVTMPGSLRVDTSGMIPPVQIPQTAPMPTAPSVWPRMLAGVR